MTYILSLDLLELKLPEVRVAAVEVRVVAVRVVVVALSKIVPRTLRGTSRLLATWVGAPATPGLEGYEVGTVGGSSMRRSCL